MSTSRTRRLTRVSVAVMIVAAAAATTGPRPGAGGRANGFDHGYDRYSALLEQHVVGTRVDYQRLVQHRPTLGAIVDDFGRVTERDLAGWAHEERLAYWINAYNVFTLDAITRNYPIRNRWFTIFGFVPPNSIKQIPGVWTRLRWTAGGAERTLDEIEHEIIRVRFDEPLIHFAVNCAAISCPPLRREPYSGRHLDGQLAASTRAFLSSPHGIVVDGSTLRVSRIFSWYGDDFVERYADRLPSDHSARDRAILGVVAEFGPPDAARLAQRQGVEIDFLDYDWSLNDVMR